MSKLNQLFSGTKGKEKVSTQTEESIATQPKQDVRHIAIIMDGNGRWATQRHLPRLAGHKAGVDALRRVVRCCADEHIEMLSVYAFSTENWGRPRPEVEGLMRLFWETIRSDMEKLHREGVRIRHLGRLQGLSPDIQVAVQELMDLTKDNTRVNLNVCFNYGGRAELVDAIRQMIADGCCAEAVDEDMISSYLYTRNLPDPDLVIRTGGEMRTSNFLLWQSAYSEYYPTPTLWPDFGHADLMEAIESYARRQRRFGRVAEPTK